MMVWDRISFYRFNHAELHKQLPRKISSIVWFPIRDMVVVLFPLSWLEINIGVILRNTRGLIAGPKKSIVFHARLLLKAVEANPGLHESIS